MCGSCWGTHIQLARGWPYASCLVLGMVHGEASPDFSRPALAVVCPALVSMYASPGHPQPDMYGMCKSLGPYKVQGVEHSACMGEAASQPILPRLRLCMIASSCCISSHIATSSVHLLIYLPCRCPLPYCYYRGCGFLPPTLWPSPAG